MQKRAPMPFRGKVSLNMQLKVSNREDGTEDPVGQTDADRIWGSSRSSSGSCWQKWSKDQKKEKETQHACFRRCGNSSGAAINPDTKKGTRQHGKQAELRLGAGTTSLAPAGCSSNVGHWLALRNKVEFHYFCSEPHPTYLSVSSQAMKQENWLPAGHFIQMVLTSQALRLGFWEL